MVGYSRRQILLVSLIVEGALAGIYFVWFALRGESIGGIAFWRWPTQDELLLGLAGTLPLFFLNFTLFGKLGERVSCLRSCYEFRDRVVQPLANQLDWVGAVLVSLCAGIGEELFFRGVIQGEAGIIIASLAFSFLHFGRAATKYALVVFVYTVIGFYFGFLASYSDSLLVPIISHAVYDLGAILYLRYL